MYSVELTAATLACADCSVVVTSHKDIDWALVAKRASLLVDTRRVIAAGPKDIRRPTSLEEVPANAIR